jgi:predicted 3-demethylubiquinone-9 3-methyltransferase (glyoxalase superfamily)
MEAGQNNTQKITPFLWFDNNAEEAIQLYTMVFKNSLVKKKAYYGDSAPGMKGKLMTAVFELNGQEFIALNGGPMYQFTPAVSFVIACQTQEEIDHYWNALSEGGREDRCGWLQDKFGISWQVVPSKMESLMSSDAARSGRVMQAMLKMKKLDLAQLQQAYDGATTPSAVA